MSNERAFFTMIRDEWQGGDMLMVFSAEADGVRRTVALFLSHSRADGEIRFAGIKENCLILSAKQ
jgi:hypothetical protein